MVHTPMVGGTYVQTSTEDRSTPEELAQSYKEVLREGEGSECSWYGPWQPMNSESMFILQLHPLYRLICAFIYGLFGFLLTYAAGEHLTVECGKVHFNPQPYD